MIEVDTDFLLTECRRCARLVFAGVLDGAATRLDTLTVPRAHAEVLRAYGYGVVVADRVATGLRCAHWRESTHDLTRAGRYLLTLHVCSAPRLRRRK